MPNQKLVDVAAQVKAGQVPVPVTVRELLSWFGMKRRGTNSTARVREALEHSALVTVPDFETVWIDSEVTFQPRTDKVPQLPDPTPRVAQLDAANRKPVSVTPNDTITRATTLMMTHDFSQLPVMTGERELKGVVSWKSIGTRLALGKQVKTVQDCLDPANEVPSSASLFSAIELIVQHDYLLVRDATKLITGIVTTYDLSVQFKLLAEPFLLLGEIENYLRRVIHGKFTAKELDEAKDPGDPSRQIQSPSDMTFGEYRRLLEKPARWEKLKLAVDRVEFIAAMERVRLIRNDVMHFDPDEVDEDAMKTLRDVARLLRELAQLKAI